MSHDPNPERHHENGMSLSNSRVLLGVNKTYLLISSTYSLVNVQSVSQSVNQKVS